MLFSSNSFKQISLEWQSDLYISMRVTNDTFCNYNEETVFTRPWFGADIGCDCTGVSYDGYDMDGKNNRINPGIACS